MDAIQAFGRRVFNSLLPSDRSGVAPGADEEPNKRNWVVAETSSSDHEDEAFESDSDIEQAGPVVLKPRFRFRIHQEAVSYTNDSEYKSSVLNWSSKPYFGHRPFDSVGTNQPPRSKKQEPVAIGPCTIAEVQDMVRKAADKAGCSISCHKGTRLMGTPPSVLRQIRVTHVNTTSMRGIHGS